LGRIAARYGIGDRDYVLSLNTLVPRKNVDGILRAFREVKRDGAAANLCLVLVGAAGWAEEARKMESLVDELEIRDDVITTGFVADEDLAALYSGAKAFVYLSRYEGFGLPPLEAMQCGTP